MYTIILSLLGVGILWGATNPFIRLASKGFDQSENLRAEIRMIGTRLRYWIPFLLNQTGSVLYVWTLQNTNIIAAVPVANSLSFAFTAITAYFLGERIPGKNVVIGTLFVSLGSYLMIYDQIYTQKQQEKRTFEMFTTT